MGGGFMQGCTLVTRRVDSGWEKQGFLVLGKPRVRGRISALQELSWSVDVREGQFAPGEDAKWVKE